MVYVPRIKEFFSLTPEKLMFHYIIKNQKLVQIFEEDELDKELIDNADSLQDISTLSYDQ